MNRLKRKLSSIGLISLLGCGLAGCDNKEVGSVSLGLFTTKDIKITVLQDPDIAGVTCHFANIEANLDWADPSDMSIACRQTGEITAAMLVDIDRSKSGEIIFKKSKSVLFKHLKIRRIYDLESQTLLYLSYSTKETSGSHKHSLSTVPLWGTKSYRLAIQAQ